MNRFRITTTKKSGHNRAGILVLVATVLALGAYAEQYTALAADTANTTFQVNVAESLAVTLTTPTSTPTGDSGVFLRNTVQLTVSSNNTAGFTASMYSANGTNLVNDGSGIVATQSYMTKIETLAGSAQRSTFPQGYWGYSLSSASLNGNTYNESGTESGDIGSAGNLNSYYYPMRTSASPITVLSSNVATASSQNIYFGAKASDSKAAGTYSGTVIISVVSGVIESNSSDPDYNPVNPVNPATPGDDNTYNDNTATTTTNNHGVGASTAANGGALSGVNVETNTSNSVVNGTSTTETTITTPLGVTETTSSNLASGAPLATGLAITAVTAATSGLFFFIAAKRRDDDDDEEDENGQA